MALRKITKNPAAPVEIRDPESKRRWPTLLEFLSARTYEDAARTPRKTATLTLFLRDDGALGCVLNDKDNGRNCFAASTAIMTLLDAIETVCSSDDTEWREDRAQTGTSKRIKNR